MRRDHGTLRLFPLGRFDRVENEDAAADLRDFCERLDLPADWLLVLAADDPNALRGLGNWLIRPEAWILINLQRSVDVGLPSRPNPQRAFRGNCRRPLQWSGRTTLHRSDRRVRIA